MLAPITDASDYYANLPKWEKSVTGVRLFDILQNETPSLVGQPVRAVSCARPKTLKTFLGLSPKKKGLVLSPVGVSFLQKRGRLIKDVIRALRSTQTGNLFSELFLPQFGYQFKIQQMNDSVKNQFGARAQFVIAAYNPQKKTLFYNGSSEVGRAAVALLHEITHSLDQESHHAVRVINKRKDFFRGEMLRVVNSTKMRRRKESWDLHFEDYNPEDLRYLKQLKIEIDQMETIRSFRTERVAYDASYKVWKELARLYPEYYRPPRRRLAQNAATSFLPVNFTDAELVSTLRLNATTVSKYLSGACKRIGNKDTP